jgi:CubicO group peptidase (beta-lactamase class C family)
MESTRTPRPLSDEVVDCYYYPPAGHGLATQSPRRPEEVGLDETIVPRLAQFIRDHPFPGRPQRWALWRHGYLVHVEGEITDTVDVASLRKTWHAMAVGAAIQQHRIPSHHQKIGEWLPHLTGPKAEATWWHLLTQSAGFDYPYGDYPDFAPGEMWTYSDWNLVHLCHALAAVYGKNSFWDHYEDVLKAAYFDALGMEGWSTVIRFDGGSKMYDGVRMVLSLEHKGRLGLLALARGRWRGEQLVPRWFVEELERKQTYGMRVNYYGPNDGKIALDRFGIGEAPYGYLTWVNTDGDYFPGASTAWAWGSGAGGNKVLWNRDNGIVFAASGLTMEPGPLSVPQIIDRCIAGPSPLVPA